MDYKQLVDKLNSIKNEKQRVNCVANFVLNNIEYNYVFLDHSKVCKYLVKNEPDDVLDFSNEEQVIQFIKSLAPQLGLTEDYKNLMIEKYLNLKSEEWLSFGRIMPTIISATFETEILKKGVCIDIAKFVKKVCDDCGVECKVVRGYTGFAHDWNLIKFDGVWQNYDFTYAIYSRDGYKDLNKKTTPNDWLDITDDRLKQLHPERTWQSSTNEQGIKK